MTLVIGHRGASGYRPEHTAQAYRLAFDLGADAVEPDVVATRDGVLVVRHENEISGTTDIGRHPEFAHRRTTKRVDGVTSAGWFTEDFTWDELSTLRAIERLPRLRPESAAFDGQWPILRLRDLPPIIDAAQSTTSRPLRLVVELKHAGHFASIGLPLESLLEAELGDWATGDNVVWESFEQSVLHRVRERLPGPIVFLADASGAPADLPSRTYAEHLTDDGLRRLRTEGVDGVSVEKSLILGGTDLVARVRAAGMIAFTWTLRAENRFLQQAMRRGREPGAYGDWRSEFGAILRTGVDGVFADQPDLVRALLDPGPAPAPPPPDSNEGGRGLK